MVDVECLVERELSTVTTASVSISFKLTRPDMHKARPYRHEPPCGRGTSIAIAIPLSPLGLTNSSLSQTTRLCSPRSPRPLVSISECTLEREGSKSEPLALGAGV